MALTAVRTPYIQHAHKAREPAPDYPQEAAARGEVLESGVLDQEAENDRSGSHPGPRRPWRKTTRAAGGGRHDPAGHRRRPDRRHRRGGCDLVRAEDRESRQPLVHRHGEQQRGDQLYFANSGLVGKVAVQLGQTVQAGQVLATETSPSTTAAISADRAAIAADKASLAESKVSGTQASIAAAGAQLAKDQAQLASDKVKLAEPQSCALAGTTRLTASPARPSRRRHPPGIRRRRQAARRAAAAPPPWPPTARPDNTA